MTIENVIKKINRYLKKDNGEPLIVDVNNKADLEAVTEQFRLPLNTFIYASDTNYCSPDEFPNIANIIERISSTDENFFIREISTFFMLKGEKALLQELKELLAMGIEGHAVVFTYQCADYLCSLIADDKRLERRICIVDGLQASCPRLIFSMDGVKSNSTSMVIHGIHKVAKAIEEEAADEIIIETHKSRSDYPCSLYAISDLKVPYAILNSQDVLTSILPESIGSTEDWKYALDEFQTYPSWEQLISAKVGNVHNLGVAISAYHLNCANSRWMWLYFIGLKLFRAGDDWCLNRATALSSFSDELIRNIYRSILELAPNDKSFNVVYTRRKAILNEVGNPTDEVLDFCKIVLSKGKNALCYLTDNTFYEKELIIKLLHKYETEYTRDEILGILKQIYPDLYAYLLPYRFKNTLLDNYFQEYKYQKVINKILPEFINIVEQQAIDREYNAILQPRSSFIEGLDTLHTQTYFTDAMGVEYLGFIMSKCYELELMAKTTVCRCELPSITSRNKEFWDVLSTEYYPIIPIDKIDKIKHHGDEGFDYRREDRKLPIHLIRELELIDALLKKIKADLRNGNYGKAILISDHGASRLAVIHGTENTIQMASNGIHSGRCCPKNEIDVRPDSAADADDFWVLANYDRFKGSRRANVEVHGGATLEEVVVPIIEITYLNASVEVKIMPIDAPAAFIGVPEITVSYRKKAAIKIFATQKLMDVSVEIDGHMYEAKPLDENFYIVEAMPEIRRAKKEPYSVDVFSCGNRIAAALPLIVKKESGSEKSIL